MKTIKPSDDLNRAEIDTIVSLALQIIATHTDIEVHCPCGSGLPLIDDDACASCLEAMQSITPFADCYDDLEMDEVDGEIEL